MTAETQRTLIVVGRKVVFAGLVLLIVWLGLLGLRGTISAGTIDQMNAEMRMEATPGTPPLPLDPRSWDWSKSLWSGKPVSGIVGERLGGTLGFIGVTAALSFVIAMVFLFIGMLIVRPTRRPAWFSKTRSTLGLLVVTAAASTPIFAWQTLSIVYPSVWWGVPGTSPLLFIIGVLGASTLPAWLLVQHGQGVLSEWPAPGLFDAALWRHLAVSLGIKVLRLVGAIIVLSMFVALSSSLAGMGRLFIDVINRRDFPVIFGIAWALVVIVVLAKLAADLIEIAYNHRRRPERDELTSAPHSNGAALPKWVPVACLALVAVSLGVAIAAPAIATHGYNEMVINSRLQPPSPQYILGTDNLGRDVFSRLIFGIRQDVFLGLLAAGIMLALAVGWAILGARARKSDDWRGDTLEDLVMVPRDVLYAFPWLVLLLLLMSLVGMPSSGPVTLLRFSLPVALIAGLVLLPRAVAMMQEAYRSPPDGKGWLQTTLLSIPVMVVFAVAGAILFIAGASYLGFGVFPPAPELGGMLAGPARRYMLQAPWMALWPPAVLILLLTAWVLAGQSLLERLGFQSRALWAKVWE